jgi:hypothetical protein
VASRFPGSKRRARLRCAALGVLAWAAAGAASAQHVDDGLGLRGTSLAGDPAASADPSAPTEPEAPPKPRKTPLPPLAPYPGAQRLDQRGGPKGSAAGPTPAPSTAALPAPPPRKRALRDEKPFEPLGFHAWGLKVTPYVEESLGWSSNPLLLPGSQQPSAFLRSEGGFGLDTDWATNALHGDFRGGWTNYFADPSANSPFAHGLFNGRWDVSRDVKLDGEVRLAVTTLTAGSLGVGPNVAFGPTGAPLTGTYGATLGGDERFGRLDLALHGLFDRTVYQDVTYSNGTTQELSADNFDDWALRGRATYEMSPGFKPFVDVLVDTRRYGDGLDEYDYARDSNGVAVRVGAEIDLTKTLTGFLDLGYGVRDYDDPRLANL